MICTHRGFVKFNKIQKSEKKSKVGGWVKSQLGFFGGKLCEEIPDFLFLKTMSKIRNTEFRLYI